jgi:hypothetical protein
MATTISNGESGSSVRAKLNDIWDGLELNEIAASIADTAVDVFVYDTSKDSDGGAWRKRTQATSWYNETLNTATRGSRKEFPAVAVIVAESNKVTIYDGDDPSLPMWMVFTNTGLLVYASTTLTGISMVNGLMSFGATFGAYEVNFLSEKMRFRQVGNDRSQSNISTRNTAALIVNGLLGYIVGTPVNDVAMTVLPNAPIDPATGLPVPTIAVATDGGVSVIKDDGTVVDLTRTGSPMATVDFHDGYLIFGSSSVGAVWYYDYIPSSDEAVSPNDGHIEYYDSGFANKFSPSYLGYQNTVTAGSYIGTTGNNNFGLTAVDFNPASYTKSSTAHITSTYNTGWMPGDIKGAFLSDTDDTDLVGSGELVTNGDFATNDDTGWTRTIDNGWDFSGGAAAHTGATGGRIRQAIATVIGKRYCLVFDLDTTGDLSLANTSVSIRNSADNNSIAALLSANLTANAAKEYVLYFTATETTHYVAFYSEDGATLDNVSVKLADADRSVNNNGLIVNGTVTRTPVATGADLVAYSGFSASNYLEQPYNSGLDFGTGDFCVMGWLKGADTYCGLVDRGTGTAGFGNSFAVGGNATSKLYGKVGASSGYSSADVWSGTWRFVCLVRSSGVAYFFVDGLASGSFTATDNVTNTSAITRLGLRTDGAASFDSSSYMALWRISATAPTAEAIAKIYNDEKHLFVENAACTLAGTSDAVTALAHDSSTGLLHVGSSYGRSVFQGLRRVSNTTTAVGTAISASNGLVVEE